LEQIRIGTRGSSLALYQTNWVAGRLRELNPGLHCEVEVIKTVGDQVQDRPLDQLGVQGAFTKELDVALLSGRVDLVVHSLKDQPTKTADGLQITAIPERADHRDVYIDKDGLRLSERGDGARIGTSSIRRRAQLTAINERLRGVPIRGNVDTRLRKLREGQFDGIILAAAGLTRLGLESEVTEYLDTERWLPAPGQGALAVMTRADDEPVREVVAKLEHFESRAAVTAERALLERVEGGCHVPVGAYARIEDGRLHLEGLIASPCENCVIRSAIAGAPEEAAELGMRLADTLLLAGGKDILEHLEGGRP
jgi:hydroxymethylbilane synthase